MSTRARIGRELPDGTIRSVYTHSDGYPSYNGQLLHEHYLDPAKVDQLLDLGDLSILRPEIGQAHPFRSDDPAHGTWCVAYGRDRGESGTEASVDPVRGGSAMKALQRAGDQTDAEFVYLYDLQGVWWVARGMTAGRFPEGVRLADVAANNWELD